jgi:hypothetical protein
MEIGDKGLTSVFISVDEDYEVEFIRVVDLNDFYIFDITSDNFDEYKDRLVETDYMLSVGYDVDESFSFDNYLSIVSMQELDKYSMIAIWRGKNYSIVYNADKGEVEKLHYNSAYYYLGNKRFFDKANLLGLNPTNDVDESLILPVSNNLFTVYSCGTTIINLNELLKYDEDVLMIPAESTALWYCSLSGERHSTFFTRLKKLKLKSILIHKNVKYIAYCRSNLPILENTIQFENILLKSDIIALCSRELKFVLISHNTDKLESLSNIVALKLKFYD